MKGILVSAAFTGKKLKNKQMFNFEGPKWKKKQRVQFFLVILSWQSN